MNLQIFYFSTRRGISNKTEARRNLGREIRNALSPTVDEPESFEYERTGPDASSKILVAYEIRKGQRVVYKFVHPTETELQRSRNALE